MGPSLDNTVRHSLELPEDYEPIPFPPKSRYTILHELGMPTTLFLYPRQKLPLPSLSAHSGNPDFPLPPGIVVSTACFFQRWIYVLQ